MEFVRELRVVRQLELPVTVRLQAVRLPDAAHRAGADPAGRSHHVRRPVRRLARRIGQGQRHHPFGHLGREAGDPRRPGLVAQQALYRNKITSLDDVSQTLNKFLLFVMISKF